MPSNPRGPMLAQKYDPAKVAFPCFVQAKLDGVRCLAYVRPDHTVELRSRDDKPIHMQHVKQAVQQLKLTPGTVLDGELYQHGVPFQELSGNVRREQWDSRKAGIGYHVYDVLNDSLGGVHTEPYASRAEWLCGNLGEMIGEQSSGAIQHVEFRIANTAAEIAEYELWFVKLGYEGAMVRTGKPSKPTKKNPDVTITPDFYEAEWHGHGRRSWFLQKVKSFDDAEATITGIEEEISNEGEPKGRTGKFVMQEADGTVFRASGITDEMKADSWANPGAYIGQLATFKFFGRSTGNTPRHPNFKALRPVGQLDEPV